MYPVSLARPWTPNTPSINRQSLADPNPPTQPRLLRGPRLLRSRRPRRCPAPPPRDPGRPRKMETTVNSLAYKGSISDAINQSRQQKKLFVVFISGEDEASSSLEQSTLVDKHAVEVIGRCCIFLHLKQGNMDAAQFSAIYPQKSVPSISVIGLNGVMLWHHEGHITSENLKESIEKAWAALHLQQTAATLLTASIASRNAQRVNATCTTLPHQQGSSTSETPSASSNQPADIPRTSAVAHSADLVPQYPNRNTHDESIRRNGKGSELVSDSCDRTVENSACTEVKSNLPDSSRSSNKGTSSDSKPHLNMNNNVNESCVDVPSDASPSTITSSGLSSQLLGEQEKAATSSAPDEVSNSLKTDDIHLSIRMPSGNRLEIKVTKQDVLREVKNFVDENLGSGVGLYDLSMIYPKRVFTEQDMKATISELGIQNRHAIMVVPHRQSTQAPRPQSSSQSYDAGGNSGGGYFGYLRTVLSYANPLSYLRGSPNSNPELQANEDHQQHRISSGQWSRPGMDSQEATKETRANTLRRRTRPFGANVHTLGSEERSSSDDRNVFWNGNSTEFGGDDRNK